jgi:DNA excision repair protein ERCC-2
MMKGMLNSQANDDISFSKWLVRQDVRMTEPTDTTEQTSDNQIQLAVRVLAESVHRQGGLAGPEYGGVLPADGIRLHQRFLAELTRLHEDAIVRGEVKLQTTVIWQDLTLLINGRCDALIESAGQIRLVEAKSFAGPPDRLPPDGEPVHWAQAMLYGWLYLSEHPDLSEMIIGLAYVGLDSPDLVEKSRLCSRAQLKHFFADTCARYGAFAANILKSRSVRRQSGLTCRFPYPLLRAGQKRFMREVVGAARQKGTVFIQAPTGTGKTIAALYPAVKVLANRLTSHVFYLTNMTSARLVAARTMDDLHGIGLLMKSLVLYAKEKLCLVPELYCDPRRCPFAIAYYDHLPAALRELFLLDQIGQEEILACARCHQVCPFELSLDMAVYCEIIICDYNYAFDPRVRLIRFFNQDDQSHLLLVDEAHNLPARSRAMFSAALNLRELETAAAVIPEQAPLLKAALDRVLGWLRTVSEAIGAHAAGFDQVERLIKADAVMAAEDFRAVRELPHDLLSACSRFNLQCHQFLENEPELDGRQKLLLAFFSLLFFCRVADDFFDQAYVTVARHLKARGFEVELMCLDASAKLAATYTSRHAAVFFSATLSPLDYYRRLLAGHDRTDHVESLLLDSPFPAEHLLVLTCTALSTRFKQREATIQPILALTLCAVRQRIGNYLVFVPSFAYLNLLRGLLKAWPERDDFDCMFQIRDMKEDLRQKYLRRFDHFGSRTLLAFAVAGGVFSEGIDLVGEKLAGVIVIGVGLPQICPEREIMKQYYGQILGSGYEYAYLYPGFNKVQQAAGRVIRSENDRGFVLLIDDRYSTDAYTTLFPAEWQPQAVADELDLAERLQVFWNQAPDPV